MRLEAGPKALDRLPEAVIHAAESLWHACLDQSRTRAQTELRRDTAAMDSKQSEQELRGEVLALREQELKARLGDRDRTIAILESETKAFASLFKKEQARSTAEAQRIVALQGEIESLRKLLASLSVSIALKRRATPSAAAHQPKNVANRIKVKVAKSRKSKITRKSLLVPQARRKMKRPVR